MSKIKFRIRCKLVSNIFINREEDKYRNLLRKINYYLNIRNSFLS